MTQSHTKILDLVNRTNRPAVPLTLENVTLNEMTVDSGPTWNTRIVLNAIVGKGYQRTVPVFYRRIPLSELGTGLKFEVDPKERLTPATLLTKLNLSRSAWVDLEDLNAFEIPQLAPGNNFVTLAARADSVGWTGQVALNLYVPLAFTPPAITIGDARFVRNYPLPDAVVTNATILPL